MAKTRSQKLYASSSARLLKPSRRRKRRPKEAGCTICQQLLGLLLARNKQPTVLLGKPQIVIGQSNCKVHKDLFLNYLNINLATTQIKRIEAHREPRNRDIELTAVFPDDPLSSREYNVPSRGWGLATRKSLTYNEGKVLLVDPKWIDSNQMRRWKQDCDAKHPSWCRNAYRVSSLESVGPQWLIDCWRNCLIVAQNSYQYVALSYVWGGVPMYQTRKADLEALQKPAALWSRDMIAQIPASIRHAISLTPFLRERYLWVDSLCIVQDDDVSKHQEIQKMAGIYNNATLTIILKYDDATHGIPGLRGISEPRNYSQQLFRIGRGYQMTQAMWAKISYNTSTWSTRAWTFQEGLLSPRRLVFQAQTVYWDCYCARRCFEDFNSVTADWDYAEESRYREAIYESFPDMCRLGELVGAYNGRKLTYPEDAHDAFAGLLASLSHSFLGGFIYGLPIMNLEMGLIWEPETTVALRSSRDTSRPPLPSWSWVAWDGAIDRWAWYQANDYVKKTPRGWSLEGAHLSERTVPLVQWYMYEIGNSKELNKVPVQNTWLEAREKYLIEGACDLPEGWSRFEYVFRPGDFNGNYYQPDHGVQIKWYYKHESSSDAEFWYPVPIPPNASRHDPKVYLPVISCWTERTKLYGAEQISEYFESTIALRDVNGHWAGCLRLHESLKASIDGNEGFVGPRNHDMVGFAFELARISIGYNYENLELSNHLTEWKCSERPKKVGIAYVYYHVLWIVWQDGMAFRRGVGRVQRDVWDKQDTENIHLVLG